MAEQKFLNFLFGCGNQFRHSCQSYTEFSTRRCVLELSFCSTKFLYFTKTATGNSFLSIFFFDANCNKRQLKDNCQLNINKYCQQLLWLIIEIRKQKMSLCIHSCQQRNSPLKSSLSFLYSFKISRGLKQIS